MSKQRCAANAGRSVSAIARAFGFVVLFAWAALAAAQTTIAGVGIRPPAVPVVAHDPYFSIWSMANRLTDGPTRHWTGAPQELCGIVRVDGKNYRFLGVTGRDEKIPALDAVRREL